MLFVSKFQGNLETNVSVPDKERIKMKSKREQLIDAEFGIIQATGKISGNIKDILYLEDLEERKSNIEKVKENLGELYGEMLKISDALRIDFDEIINKKG